MWSPLPPKFWSNLITPLRHYPLAPSPVMISRKSSDYASFTYQPYAASC